jgi:hypothetical protein
MSGYHVDHTDHVTKRSIVALYRKSPTKPKETAFRSNPYTVTNVNTSDLQLGRIRTIFFFSRNHRPRTMHQHRPSTFKKRRYKYRIHATMLSINDKTKDRRPKVSGCLYHLTYPASHSPLPLPYPHPLQPPPPKSSTQPSHHSNTHPSPSPMQQTAPYAPPQSKYLVPAFPPASSLHVYLPPQVQLGNSHKSHNQPFRRLPMLLRRWLWGGSWESWVSSWEADRCRGGGMR